MVAAWISAETGVGPCMASGSQIYRGIWADLPVQPRNRKRVIAVAAAPPGRKAAGALGKTDRKSTRLNSSHGYISYAGFCLKKKKKYSSQLLHTSVRPHLSGG